jgi:myo-inositol 2-dehydrogenase/D-chiro-inositol 1-dehydrogenase
MVRFAVLGAGRIGSIHARNIASQQGARLALVCDADRGVASAVAAELGAAIGDLEEALAGPEIDAVVICTPTDTHAELIDRAAAAGKAIF